MMFDDKKRIQWIDLAKGFCICLVVFFHTKGILGCKYIFDPFISSFRMPLYFFLSGLFFNSKYTFSCFFKKKVNRLLIPFVFFYLCFSVIVPNVLHYVFGQQFNTVIGWPSLWAFLWPGMFPNIPIWFLWCLFIMNILFRTIYYLVYDYYNVRTDIILFVICLTIGITGYQLLEHNIADIGFVLTTLKDLPFFYMGFLFKKCDGLLFIQSLNISKSMLLSILFLLLTILFTIIVNIDSFFIFYLCGLTGTLFTILLSRCFISLPFFSYVGRYSIIVLVTHGIIVSATNYLYTFFANITGSIHISTLIMTLFTLSTNYLIIPIIIRYFPHVTAQKPLFKEKILKKLEL